MNDTVIPRASLTSGGLIRTAVQLSQEQYAEVGALARERQVSVAAIVREAVRGYLAEQKRQREALAA
jgi:predicted DNA-binding ribbon-helix-helix protein